MERQAMNKFASSLASVFDIEPFELNEQDLLVIMPNKKSCPRCGLFHTKRGAYCSRSCGNVRTYTPEQKAQKSIAHKNPTIHVSQKELKDLFSYDPINGGLLYNTEAPITKNNVHLRNNGQSRIGLPAGRINQSKKHIDIDGKAYLEHRLVYYWHTGEYPRQIDHINVNSLDNRIENLRPCVPWQNMANTRTRANKPRGVSKCRGGYTAKISVNRFVYDLGVYDTEEEAYNAYCAKHHELRGEFAIKLPPYSAYSKK